MTIKKQMNLDYADGALLAFKTAAERAKVDWCLYAGTCLGLFRDGRFLPDDNDIDVAVRATAEQVETLWKSLDRLGFKLGKFCENVDGSRNRHVYFHPKIMRPEEGGLLVDVFYHFSEEEENLLRWFDAIWYRERFWFTPHPTDEYLQAAYGEWWDKTLRNAAAGKEDVQSCSPG